MRKDELVYRGLWELPVRDIPISNLAPLLQKLGDGPFGLTVGEVAGHFNNPDSLERLRFAIKTRGFPYGKIEALAMNWLAMNRIILASWVTMSDFPFSSTFFQQFGGVGDFVEMSEKIGKGEDWRLAYYSGDMRNLPLTYWEDWDDKIKFEDTLRVSLASKRKVSGYRTIRLGEKSFAMTMDCGSFGSLVSSFSSTGESRNGDCVPLEVVLEVCSHFLEFHGEDIAGQHLLLTEFDAGEEGIVPVSVFRLNNEFRVSRFDTTRTIDGTYRVMVY